jgi:molybdopterin/thiamine biosynthesis adenylyltransferase
MIVSANLINTSANGRKAMVTVISGEGAKRRSTTRHIVRDGNRWVGNNPNDSAKRLNLEAEAGVTAAQEGLAKATVALETLKTATEVDRKVLGKARSTAFFAKMNVNQKTKRLEFVRQNFPLIVEFRF